MSTYKRWQFLTNIQIEKIWPGGIGISTLDDGKKLLIKGAVLPHSTIEGRITKIRKDYIELDHVSTVAIQEGRASESPQCSHYHHPLEPMDESQVHKYSFAWCKWQIVPYDKQLLLKQDIVQESFRGYDYLLEQAPLQEILPSPLIHNYRNKLEFSFWKYITKKSNDQKALGEQSLQESQTLTGLDQFSHYHTWQLGYHKQWHYDKIVDVDYCCLASEQINTLYLHLKNLCQKSGLTVYDQKRHDGVLRNIVFREWHATGEVMINLVVAKNNIEQESQEKKWKNFIKILESDTTLRKDCTTFLITDNSTLSDAIRRKEATLEVLRGEGVITENLEFQSENTTSEATTLQFQISPTSFFQTNTTGAQTLFTQAISYAQLPAWKTTILDLYCGTGTIWLSFLKQGKGTNLLGIEIVEEAIEDAKINAKLNNLWEQSYFVAGKVEDLIKSDKHIQESLADLGLIILDPPRAGLHPSVPSFLTELKQNHSFQLIYISCNPATLARDLDLLVQGWWKLETLQPVDMFPHTHHVEMISVLS